MRTFLYQSARRLKDTGDCRSDGPVCYSSDLFRVFAGEHFPQSIYGTRYGTLELDKYRFLLQPYSSLAYFIYFGKNKKEGYETASVV
jgi:hypothetical protein